MQSVVRAYRSEDRKAVRQICCETGFMGRPVDRFFSDRKLFADFFTAYYTDWEPENAMVSECRGEVTGYILCCTRYGLYPWVQGSIVARSLPRVLGKLAKGSYCESDRRFLRWFLGRSIAETPKAPRRSAHFHINLLKGHRNNGTGRQLFERFMRHLRQTDASRIYGQIQTFNNRRSDRVFENFGFELFDRRRVTKFNKVAIGEVYVSTFTRKL